jgi:hypothetical protein
VLHLICCPGNTQRGNSGYDEDGDTPHLAHSGCISHLLDDGWDEEARCIASINNTHIHEHTAPYLPVREDPSRRPPIQDIHSRLADIDSETFEQECALGIRQEARGLWPIHDTKFEGDGDEDCE